MEALMFLVDTLIVVIMVYGGAVDDRARGRSPQRSLFRHSETARPKAPAETSWAARNRFR